MSTVTIDNMRYYLKTQTQYKSETWSAKVDKMTDKQVYAVYMRIISKKEN